MNENSDSFSGWAFRWHDPKIVVADVGILRSIDNESCISEASPEVVVKVIVDLGIRNIDRPAFQTMLTNHNRATFARLHTFGKK